MLCAGLQWKNKQFYSTVSAKDFSCLFRHVNKKIPGAVMKGIIVAAGYGTRFLPVTKTVPKEMLPIIDKPSVAFIIEEFIDSGIDEIIIISSRRKKALEDFLDREIELESIFKKEGDNAKLSRIEPYRAKFYFVRQKEMKGTGHALLQVKAS